MSAVGCDANDFRSAGGHFQGGSSRGFTYIGLLIFLALLGLASGLTLTVGSLMQRRANEEELMFIGKAYEAAFRTYFESTPVGQRPFPSRLDDLLSDPRYPGVKRHLRRLYADPITGKQTWGLVAAPGGGLMGVHSLSQETPIRVTGFDTVSAMTDNAKRKYSDWIFGFAAAPAPVRTKPASSPGSAATIDGAVLPRLP